MRGHSFAWFMTAVAVVMAVVSGARISRGWPAGGMTYAFLLATVVVVATAILAWRRANADPPARRD